MARVDVRLNSRGVKRLLNDKGVRRFLREKARLVEQAAKDSAPVETGAYRDSITIVDATTDRAVVRVVAEDDKAMLVESRTGNLARAVDAARGGG